MRGQQRRRAPRREEDLCPRRTRSRCSRRRRALLEAEPRVEKARVASKSGDSWYGMMRRTAIGRVWQVGEAVPVENVAGVI